MEEDAFDQGDAATPSSSPRGLVKPAAAFGAFLVCCGALTANLSTWVEHRGGRVAEAAGAPAVTATMAAADPSASLARVAAVQPLLARRAAAARTGRPGAWGLTLDPAPAATVFRARQLVEFDRIRQLPLRNWHYQVLETEPLPAVAGAVAFTAKVRLGYRLTGDLRDVERVQTFTVSRRAGGWVLSALRGDGGEADPWELGPLTVSTGRRSVVIAIGRTAGLAAQRTSQEIDAAAARVDAVWGTGWPRTVVAIVPQDQGQLATTLGRVDTSGLNQIAAITTGSADAVGATAGAVDRVVLNPAPFNRLTALGRRVVLTHELTHVATRATSRVSPPLWVEEGFANYVAYRDSGLSRGVIAADALPLVRAGTAAAHLPAADDFDPAHGPIAPAYADAWLAFDLMAAGRPRRPLDFFRIAAGTSGTETPPRAADQAVTAAFHRVLGIDQEEFEARWRAHREALVRPPR